MEKVLFVGMPDSIADIAAGEALKAGLRIGLYFPEASVQETVPDYIKNNADYCTGIREELEAAFKQFNPKAIIDFGIRSTEQLQWIYNMAAGNIEQYIYISGQADTASCEQFLFEKFKRDAFPVTLLRTSATLKAGNSAWLAARLKSGKAVISPGDGNRCRQISLPENMGKMIAGFIGKSESIGQEYILTDGNMVTFDGYVDAFSGALGIKPEIIHIPQEFLKELEGMEEYTEGNIPVEAQYNEKAYDDIIKRWFMLVKEFKKNIWQ